jgi:hypothetical protein
MASGCNMVRKGFNDAIKRFETSKETHDWPFLRIASALQESREEILKPLSRLLTVGGSNALKVWHLSRFLRAVVKVGGAGMAFGLLWILFQWRDAPFGGLERMAADLALIAVTVFATSLGLHWIVRILNYRKTIYQIATGAALSAVGWVAAWVHLLVFDRWFLRIGRFASPDSRGK